MSISPVTDHAVKIGDTFRSVIADANVLWKVIRKIDARNFECEAVNEPIEHNGKLFDSDWAGTISPFSVDQIVRSKSFAAAFASHVERDKKGWADLEVGATVHYDNGFKQWVRCKVVLDEAGQKALLPIALVGGWRESDMPHRDRRGEVYYPYHARKIIEGEVWRPSFSMIFESGAARSQDNPASLPALDLSVPDLGEDERHAAECEVFFDALRAVMDDAATPAPERAAKVRQMVADSTLRR